MSSMQTTAFKNFASGLIPTERVDHETLKIARAWYKEFTGAHATKIDDREVVEIYTDMHSSD